MERSANKTTTKWSFRATTLSFVISDNQIRDHFKDYQINTHVQTERESHDLNMDFRSFDNGFKQLCVTIKYLTSMNCNRRIVILNLYRDHFSLSADSSRQLTATDESMHILSTG